MITDKNLSFEKFQNLVNTYANLNQIDKAINSYENALEIRFDKDTKFNLDLLKNGKKEQRKYKKHNLKV